MSFPRYPEYMDSGVEWLGEVPTHWDLVPLKQVILRIESGTSVNAIDTPAGDGEIGVLKTSCVYHGHFDADENKAVIPDEYDRVACPVTAGTLVVSRMNTPDLVGAAGVVHVSHANLFLPDRLWQVHFDGAEPNFVHHWTRTPAYRAQVEMACAGTSSSMQNLGQDQFRCFVIPRPSFSEQSAIATFLDRETAKIDVLVAEQEKLIALLQEKRQAVISHAVTKGLDPNVPMKDSGVEWLGEVPEHWVVAAVNHRYEVLLGKMLDEKRITGKHLAPYLRNVDVQWDRINTNDLPQMDFEGDDIQRYGLRKGDLLVCEGGEVGRAAIWIGALDECYYQKALHRLRPRSPLCDVSRFQYYLLNVAAKLGIFTGGEGKSTIAHLTAETLRRYRFAYPQHAEQMQITEFLDAETIKFDALTAQAHTAITLLQERRTALISAAVTGQIDVRGIASPEAA